MSEKRSSDVVVYLFVSIAFLVLVVLILLDDVIFIPMGTIAFSGIKVQGQRCPPFSPYSRDKYIKS
jgi:hypothetical protein